MPPVEHPHLYGLDASFLQPFEAFFLEQNTLNAFKQMQAAAAQEGIAINICSAHRNFDKQLAIWNAKACGKRTLLDINNQPLDFTSLSKDQLMQAILLWSALPGSSRHHWGTDIDVFDLNTISRDKLRLTTDEYQSGGPCHRLFLWLREYAQQFGFYFPYQQHLSGVSPEPWHISYYPVSNDFLAQYDSQQLVKVIEFADIELKPQILNKLQYLVEHYVRFVAPAPD